MPEGEYRQTVWTCPHCGGEHFAVLWVPMEQPKNFLDHVFTHAARCPATGEPLFMESRITT